MLNFIMVKNIMDKKLPSPPIDTILKYYSGKINSKLDNNENLELLAFSKFWNQAFQLKDEEYYNNYHVEFLKEFYSGICGEKGNYNYSNYKDIPIVPDKALKDGFFTAYSADTDSLFGIAFYLSSCPVSFFDGIFDEM